MIKLTEHRISTLLKVTAFVNIGSALAALLLPQLNVQLLYGTTDPLTGLIQSYHNLFWLTVFFMGIGYLIASRSPAEQTALITCGALGKISVAVIWGDLFLAGNATPLILGAVSFDGTFGFIFLIYILYHKRDRANELSELAGE